MANLRYIIGKANKLTLKTKRVIIMEKSKAIVSFVYYSVVSHLNKITEGIEGDFVPHNLPLFQMGVDRNGELVAFTKNQNGGVLCVHHSLNRGYYWESVDYDVDNALSEELENAFSNLN